MSFQQGLSGLNANSKSLEVIGNNIANANTFGAKTARAEFADMYAAAINSAGTNQIGMGVALQSVAQQFTQGNISSTENTLDLAINGNGFFQLGKGSDLTSVMYSRNGQFKLNNAGEIVNNEGLNLLGYGVDSTGKLTLGGLQPLKLAESVPATVTSKLTMSVNLDARAEATNPVTVAKQNQVKANAALDAANDAQATSNNNKLISAAKLALAQTAYATAVSDKATALAAKLTADTNLAADPTNVTLIGLANAAQADLTAKTTALMAAGTAQQQAQAEDDQALAAQTQAGQMVASATQAKTDAGTAVTNAPNGPQIDFSDSRTYNYSAQQTVYDSNGQSVALNYYYQKGDDNAAGGANWNVYVTANGVPVNDPATNKPMSIQLGFDQSGTKPSIFPANPSFTIPSVVNAQGLQTVAITLSAADFSNSTQHGTSFSVLEQAQDGSTSGKIAGLSIQSDGKVVATYSNNKAVVAGQMELVNFRNLQGLESVGGNLWRETLASGQPSRGVAGEGTMGKLQSKALEESNVDLTAELVNMITAQRMYQANAQTIKTQDQVLQTLVSLR